MPSPKIPWKRILAGLTGILVLAWIAVLGITSWNYIESLTHPACPAGAAQTRYQAVTLKFDPNHSLRGWWQAPRNGAVVLLLGGHSSNRDALLPEADLLTRRGYGILAVEPLACSLGVSTLGYREVESVRVMVDFARSQPGVRRLGILGFSVGGVTAIRAAARLPELRAVIAEGSFANLYNEMTADPAAPLSLTWQIQRATALAYRFEVGVWPGQISPLDDLAAVCPRPVLLIHGEKEAAHTQAAAQLAAASGCTGASSHTRLWIVPGADHGGYRQAQPEEYEQKIGEFLDGVISQEVNK